MAASFALLAFFQEATLWAHENPAEERHAAQVEGTR
jgi:hypothetical protein